MSEDSKTNDFIELYSDGHRRIYAYVRAHVLSATDADDVMQDTATVLWQKFNLFQPGTDFVRWACQIARLKLLAHHRHHKRLLSLFSEKVFDAVAEKVIELSASANTRTVALDDCVELLPPQDRELLDLKYQSSQTVKQIAQAIHRSESAVYKSLERIHDDLYDCIEEKMKAELDR